MDTARLIRIMAPFVGLLMGALSVAAAPPAKRRPAAPPPMDAAPIVGTMDGVSSRGNLQEALDDALAKASREMPQGETVLKYRVCEISGERRAGGDAWMVRVTIQTGIAGAPRVSAR